MEKRSGTGVTSAFFVLMLLIGAFFVVANDNVSAAQDGDYAYTTGGGVATITAYTGVGGAVTIPSTLGGFNVESIGEFAFYNFNSITSIIIPNSVTTIGNNAFASCISLTSITIPNGVTSIGNDAFTYCTSLTSVTIGSGVISIGNRAFAHCSSLTSLTIPNSVTTIGNYVFSSCYALTSITIGSSLTSIGDGMFYYCYSLTSVTIPASVTTIGIYSFESCTALTAINVDAANPNYANNAGDGVLYNKAKTTLIQYPAGKAGAFTAIPATVTTIGNYAFSYSSSLTSITIPSTVAVITSRAFYSSTALTAINVDAANPNYANNAGDGVLYNKAKTTLIQYPAGKAGAFTAIPASVTTIGNSAFMFCSSLTSITIPNTVTNIGNDAFMYCSALTSVTIGSGVTSIGNNALMSCTALTSITIPSGVTSIGVYALAYCTALTAINVAAANPNYASVDGVLYDKLKTTLIQYPVSVSGAFVIPSTVTTIEASAFESCIHLTSITIPATVITMEYTSFYSCANLTSINVAAANPNFASVDGVLYDKPKTTLIQYPIGKAGAFIIPDTVTTIGVMAFNSCTALTSVTIPASVTTIGDVAFYSCTGLTSITIPNTVTTIGSSAFNSCTGLTSITIPNTVTTIGFYAFYSCTGLTSAVIGNSVTSIGVGAFSQCANLTSITFLGLGAPTFVGADWKLNTLVGMVGHAYAASNFPAPGGVWNGLKMGSVIPIVPSAPIDPTATPGNAQVVLAWTVPASDGGSPITGYKVYRSATSNGSYSLIASPSVRNYTDANLTNGQIYWYKVSGVNANGEGVQSAPIYGTPATVPTAPLSLAGTPGNTQVALTWQAPASDGGSSITGYKVYRSATSNGSYSLIASPSVTNYTDSGLTNGQTYYYKVSGVNANGEGAQCAVVSVVVHVPAPANDSTMLILVAAIAIVAVVAVVLFVMLKRKKATPPMQGNVFGPSGNVQAPQGEQYQAPPQPVPSPPQEQLPAFCPECGARTTGTQFCENCGKKVK